MKSRPNKNKNYNTNVRYSNKYFDLVVSFPGIIHILFLLLFILISSIGPFFFGFLVLCFCVFCVFIFRSRIAN